MYAWITDDNNQTWRGMIFAYYGSNQDPYNFHYVVLDADKKHLINVSLFHIGATQRIYTRVVWIDSDMSDWTKNTNQGMVNFLSDYQPRLLADQISVELLKKCIQLDEEYNYQEIVEVKGASGIKNLLEITSWFDDAHVTVVKRSDEKLKVHFAPTWGYKLTLFFDESASYDLGEDSECNWWSDASLFLEGGYFCLCDTEDVQHFDPKELNCWFRAKKMSYKLEPSPLA